MIENVEKMNKNSAAAIEMIYMLKCTACVIHDTWL